MTLLAEIPGFSPIPNQGPGGVAREANSDARQQDQQPGREFI
jgi:hypothetical protein